MIVKITLLDLDNKELVMMFGNSYKYWFTQFEEFLYNSIKWWNAKRIMSCNLYQIINVEKSTDKWIGFGGLKWCTETEFKESLAHEAKGLDQEVRKYKDMIFNYDANKFYKVKNMLKDRLRHLASSTNLEIKKEVKKFN